MQGLSTCLMLIRSNRCVVCRFATSGVGGRWKHQRRVWLLSENDEDAQSSIFGDRDDPNMIRGCSKSRGGDRYIDATNCYGKPCFYIDVVRG